MIGGGYIGCELAQMFARAGVTVTLLFRSRLLPEAEPEISEALAGYLAEDGIAVRKVRDYLKVCMIDGGVALSVQDEDGDETLEAERLLLSTGRRANTRGLGLQQAGVALAANGGIRVDERMRKTRPGVYEAGEVTGRD